MPSKVDICNEALNLLGANTISSLSETSTTAVLCNRIYDTEVDYLLRQHNWNAAVQEANLAAVTGTPIVGWLYKFLMPTDPYCLRVLNVYDTSDDDQNFQCRGRHIYCDTSAGDIIYIARIPDPDVSESMFTAYRNTLADAMAVDSQEGTPEELKSDHLLDARLR